MVALQAKKLFTRYSSEVRASSFGQSLSSLQGGVAAAALAGLFYGLGDVYGDQIWLV
jgi:hypothetical protein